MTVGCAPVIFFWYYFWSALPAPLWHSSAYQWRYIKAVGENVRNCKKNCRSARSTANPPLHKNTFPGEENRTPLQACV